MGTSHKDVKLHTFNHSSIFTKQGQLVQENLSKSSACGTRNFICLHSICVQFTGNVALCQNLYVNVKCFWVFFLLLPGGI